MCVAKRFQDVYLVLTEGPSMTFGLELGNHHMGTSIDVQLEMHCDPPCPVVGLVCAMQVPALLLTAPPTPHALLLLPSPQASQALGL